MLDPALEFLPVVEEHFIFRVDLEIFVAQTESFFGNQSITEDFVAGSHVALVLEPGVRDRRQTPEGVVHPVELVHRRLCHHHLRARSPVALGVDRRDGVAEVLGHELGMRAQVVHERGRGRGAQHLDVAVVAHDFVQGCIAAVPLQGDPGVVASCLEAGDRIHGGILHGRRRRLDRGIGRGDHIRRGRDGRVTVAGVATTASGGEGKCGHEDGRHRTDANRRHGALLLGWKIDRHMYSSHLLP